MQLRSKRWLVWCVAITAAASVQFAVHAQDDPKASDPNMAPLKIELPEPSFSGTPLDYWSEQLEFSFKPRPDYYAPKGTEVISKDKPVTSSDASVSPDKLTSITNGNKGFAEDCVVVLKPGPQWVQVDLGESYAVEAILAWHFHEYERVYFDVIVQLSDDPEFKEGVTTIFNNDHDKSSGLDIAPVDGELNKEYIEKAEGRLFDAKGTKARYVRMYSNGNSTDDTNTYIEVEVWGRPAS